MHLFYQPQLSGETIQLNEDESKHCVRVLRMQRGAEVHLTDGKGMHVTATVADDNPKKCVLQVAKRELLTSPENITLHIALAPTKNSERLEWFAEKATEIGITEISLLECTRSERTRVNMERLEKTLISAMKQSKRWWLPELHAPRSLKEFLGEKREGKKYMAWCETDSTRLLARALTTLLPQQVTVLIGPEGDFTPEEVELAQAAGYLPVSLGQAILRSETAALYTCALVRTLEQQHA